MELIADDAPWTAKAVLILSRLFLIVVTAAPGIALGRLMSRRSGWRPVATILACAALSVWSAIVLGTLIMVPRIIMMHPGPLGAAVFLSLGFLDGIRTGLWQLTLPLVLLSCVILGLIAAALARWLDRPQPT